MARTRGPLHSLRASGTIAGKITFDARGWAHTPNSPGSQRTAGRGNGRQIFLATSKAIQLCQTSVETSIKSAALPITDWRAWFMQYVIGEQRQAWINTGLVWATLAQDERTAWNDAAAAAGFADVAIAYASDDPITTGLAMFQLASALYTAGLVTEPGEPDASNAIAWATAITGYEPPAPSYVSLWSLTDTPGTVNVPDSGDYELGTVFRSDVTGQVAGLRFYKSTANTGTHTGHLWTSAGALLGTCTFTDETESGWQTAMFSTPISIAANTLYVISYTCPNGHYSRNMPYFTTSHDNAPLHAPASDDAGGNGRYNTTPGSYPADSYSESCYWVDVLFEAD